MSADDETPAEKSARQAHWAKIAQQGNHPTEIAALSELARGVLPNADIEFWSLGTEGEDEPTICVHNAAEVPDDAWYELDDAEVLGRKVFATVVFNGKTGENLGAYITLTQREPGEDDDVSGGFELVPLNRLGGLPEFMARPGLRNIVTGLAGLIHDFDPGAQVLFFLGDDNDTFENPTVLGMDIAGSDYDAFRTLNGEAFAGGGLTVRIGSFDGERWNVWLTLQR